MQLLALHQLELSSNCNLACSYCVNRIMTRPRVDMSMPVFERALEHVKRLGQIEINLAGIGESTLHPNFVAMVGKAREAVGIGGKVVFATNGVILTEDMIRGLVPSRPQVWITLHSLRRAQKAVTLLQRYGLLAGLSTDAATAPNDWAGQVEWQKPSYSMPCPWLRQGKAFVSSTGDILTCCLDAHGLGKLGHVCQDDMSDLDLKPYALCRSCYQVP